MRVEIMERKKNIELRREILFLFNGRGEEKNLGKKLEKRRLIRKEGNQNSIMVRGLKK